MTPKKGCSRTDPLPWIWTAIYIKSNILHPPYTLHPAPWTEGNNGFLGICQFWPYWHFSSSPLRPTWLISVVSLGNFLLCMKTIPWSCISSCRGIKNVDLHSATEQNSDCWLYMCSGCTYCTDCPSLQTVHTVLVYKSAIGRC